MPTDRSPVLRALRIAGLVETITYLVLVGGLVFHALGGARITGVTGPVHGVVFLVYAALVLRANQEMRWGSWPTLKALVAAAIPLGAYFVIHDLLAEPRRT